jgi:2-polyprenyl-6-methoxyphenol hydroxylase-like FAD-dependent oxidoreductase
VASRPGGWRPHRCPVEVRANPAIHDQAIHDQAMHDRAIHDLAIHARTFTNHGDDMDLEETDVLVVGAGPTGTALAIDLARRGVGVRIIEREATTFSGSRAKGLQPRSLEVLEDLGVREQVIAAGGDYPLLGIHVGPLTAPWRMIRRARPSEDRPWPNTWMVPQVRTDAILHARLAELGGQVEFGAELLDVRQDVHSVVANVRVEGREKQVVARYLVGADGGASRVRGAMGIGFAGETDDGDRWIIVDAETTGLSRSRWHVWPGRGGKMTAACPLPHTPLFQWMLRIDIDEPVDLDAAALQRRIGERTGNARIRLGSIQWRTLFRPNIRLAECYRRGRVFLAGDAAHVHTPSGGQGLNTGLQDAYNLGWKLGQVLAGADDSLLDSYEAERLPIADEMLARSTRRYRAIGKAGTESIRRTADERQLDLHYRAGPLAPATSDRTKTLQVGDRAPDARLDDAAGTPLRLFDLFRGPHFTAIACGPGAARALALSQWPTTGAALRRVAVDADLRLDVSLADARKSFRRIYGLRGDTLLLIRPDGYVGHIARADFGAQLACAARRMGAAMGAAVDEGQPAARRVDDGSPGATSASR